MKCRHKGYQHTFRTFQNHEFQKGSIKGSQKVLPLIFESNMEKHGL